MNPLLIILASIGPLIILAVLIWGIIGPDRNSRQDGVGIYGGYYSEPTWSASIKVLPFILVLTYFGIGCAIEDDVLGNMFVFASIAITTACFLR